MRKAQEDEDDDDVSRRGDVVDVFGYSASSRAQLGGPWKERRDRWMHYNALIMKLSGVSVRVEPRVRPADAYARPYAESTGPAGTPGNHS